MEAPVDASETNVFVNCPFDADYDSLLKALLYALMALGYTSRIATERADSGEQRVTKICELIRASRYSIHDLSRLQAGEEGEYYRMNMPFELGVDYETRAHAGAPYDEKQFLILETRRYAYMRALSDLNGVDIEAHGDDPRTLVRKVRNWLRTATGRTEFAAPSALWYDYGGFSADLYDKLKALDFSDDDINELPVVEYLDYVRRWLDARAT